MKIIIAPYASSEIDKVIHVWNQVVTQGIAFPQTECLTKMSGERFFAEQSYTGVAKDAESGKIAGVSILHPNNIGRCGHICNASYAVSEDCRGQGVGEALVRNSMQQAKALGFRILQFNAVVASNTAALHLYHKLGFTRMGVIPGGFRMDDGTYADIIPHYIEL